MKLFERDRHSIHRPLIGASGYAASNPKVLGRLLVPNLIVEWGWP
jgi:hypothetical protein